MMLVQKHGPGGGSGVEERGPSGAEVMKWAVILVKMDGRFVDMQEQWSGL